VAAADLKIDALDQQLRALANTVAHIAQGSQTARDSAAESDRRVNEVRKLSALRQAEFEKNSQYSVMVVHHGGGSATEAVAKDLVNTLSQEGFKASEGKWAAGTELHREIIIDYLSRARQKAVAMRSTVIAVANSHSYSATVAIRAEPRTNSSVGPDITIWL